MAVDEFLLNNTNSVPVLRIYGWSRPCLSIGYFQSIDEVDHKQSEKEGVDVVRRITGGGSVFHDKEVTYSFVTKNYPQNIMESYQEICKVIIATLKGLGFEAKFSPLNDIIIDGKKVCGNAQTRKNNTLLQHGTILLDVDVDRMFSLLKVPKEKISDKEISNVKDRVVGISKEFEQVAEMLKTSAKEIFHCELIPDQLNQKDLEICTKIMNEKYSNKKWNFKR